MSETCRLDTSVCGRKRLTQGLRVAGYRKIPAPQLPPTIHSGHPAVGCLLFGLVLSLLLSFNFEYQVCSI